VMRDLPPDLDLGFREEDFGLPETHGLGDIGSLTASAMDLLNNYVHVFLAAFLVTLLVTPIIRRIAIATNVIDRPDSDRKTHPFPVAYLGGAAVFLGLLVAVAMSYVFVDESTAGYAPVPIAIVIGMVAIAFTGFADDVWGWDPRLKIAGQLVAAAALAIEEVGVKVAAGVLTPLIGAENLVIMIPAPGGALPLDIVYWVGTGLIAVFVLGGCNAANLIDGLDGLLSGVVAIIAIGLLIISLLMLPAPGTIAAAHIAEGGESLAGARVVLCLALLGAVLGFLPHNFNPAKIIMGDAGALLLGYAIAVVSVEGPIKGATAVALFVPILALGVPIMDAGFAVWRRLARGRSLVIADRDHLHHRLLNMGLTQRQAVLLMYSVSGFFGASAVSLAELSALQAALLLAFIFSIVYLIARHMGLLGTAPVASLQVTAAAEVAAARDPQQGRGT
jgi:UDP-GlcNAc:undecaprenyl-phosphate/decaprenyl-phosphate GlcNAc-1-phosphate transferase